MQKKEYWIFFLFFLIILLIPGVDMATFKKNKGGIYDVGNDGFNFKDDVLGTAADDWTGSTIIADQLDGHLKIMKINDNTAYHTFSAGSQESGTVEFYVYVRDQAASYLLYLRDGTTNVLGLLFGIDAKIYAIRNGGNTELQALSDEQWYHISLRFERTAGGYQGLAQNNFKVFIDGTEYGDYALINNNDVGNIYFDITDGFGTSICFFDAIAWDWDASYDIGDNLNLAPIVSVAGVDVLSFEITHEIMKVPSTKATLSEDNVMGSGDMLQCTDTYSVDNQTSSAIIFEGHVKGQLSTFPYQVNVVNRSLEMYKLFPSGNVNEDSDGQINTILGADNDYIAAGSLTDGQAVGSIDYAGDKDQSIVFRNWCFFEGWIYYFKEPVELTSIAMDFNAGTTSTGISFTQASNIWDFKVGRAGRLCTSVTVQGASGYSGSATASTEDIANYGTNNFPHRDAALNTDALCNTTAASILSVLNNDPILISFYYQDATIGFIQPGQTITVGYSAKNSDPVASQTFIVNKIIYEAVTGKGYIEASSAITYDYNTLNAITQQLPQENSQLIQSTHASLESYLAIGSANARWIKLPFSGLYNSFSYAHIVIGKVENDGADDFRIYYDICIPYTLGSLSLYVSEIKVGIANSDAGDYVDVITLIAFSDEDTFNSDVELDHDTLSGTGVGEFTYDSNDDAQLPFDLSGYVSANIQLKCVATDAGDLDVTYVAIKYYYA